MDSESGTSQVTGDQELLVQGSKEKLCYVCLRVKEGMTKNPSNVEKTFHLPWHYGSESRV